MTAEDTIRLAISRAAKQHRMHPDEIREKSKRREVVDARRTAFREALDLGVTRKDLARFFGLDWSTVDHHVNAEAAITEEQERTIWAAVERAASEADVEPIEVIEALSQRAVDIRKQAFAYGTMSGVPYNALALFFGVDRTTVRKHLRQLGVVAVTEERRDAVTAPSRPRHPDLPRNRSDWSEIDWMRAMAHEENLAMRAAQ